MVDNRNGGLLDRAMIVQRSQIFILVTKEFAESLQQNLALPSRVT